jgi:DnaK suppressor protein
MYVRHMNEQIADKLSIRVHPDSGLTPAQGEELYNLLADRRRALTGEVAEHLGVGRFSGDRIAEPEEAAAIDATQSTMIELAESERKLLAHIERALRKFEDGSYGVSEESGEPIGFERLRAVPWARLGVEDQEVVEREQRARGR